MKLQLLTIVLSLSITLVMAQGSGIVFESGDWESALKKANKEDKVIFVDAYTTWCGPCKMMAKNTFTDEAVGNYFNDNFINMKIDMEKGEGLLFAKAYGVRAYPTYVFVDGKGNIAHKGLGYMEPADFIEFGEAARDEENRYGAMKNKYDSGDRSPEFLKKYAVLLNDTYDEQADEIAHEYLATQDDWTSADNAPFVVNMFQPDPGSDLYLFAKSNRKALATHADVDKLDSKLKGGVMREITYMNIPESEQHGYFLDVFSERGEEYYEEYQMRKYSRMQDDEMVEKYVSATRNYLNNYEVNNSGLLNHAAWNFYENVDDKKALKEALEWAKKSVEIDSNFANNDTVAAIYFKLGNKKQATNYAKEAIRLAKEKGQDYSDTEELLKKIESL